MPISIFWRLFSGYLVMLTLSVATASYSIVQLGTLSNTARTALNTDTRMVADEEKLTDIFLSEVRYAGRFVITHSEMSYDQFRQFKNDFIRYMNDLKTRSDAWDGIKKRLERVEELHFRYDELFEQEVHYIRANQPYAESRYQQEKSKILDSTLSELERLKRQLQTDLHVKLQEMERAARTARTIAIATALILAGLGLGCSLVITQAITGPLTQLTSKLQSENNGALGTEYSHIPEIQQLADALCSQRRAIAETAERTAAFSRNIDDQFLSPLTSLIQRISYLKAQMGDAVTAEQGQNFDLLTKETERMIQQCSQLKSPLKLGVEAEELHTQPDAAISNESTSSHRNTDWINNLRRLRTRMLRLTKSHLTRGQVRSARYWNAIFHSMRTLSYGKAKKQ